MYSMCCFKKKVAFVNALGLTILLVQAALLSEKQASEESKRASVDAEEKNTELVKKLEDAEKKVDQLQESVQRCVEIKKYDLMES